jgi:hypothetical protein
MGIFSFMENKRMGRPPKAPEDRRTESMKLPLSADEKEAIERAAHADDAKPVTWARNVLMRVVKRRIGK